MPHACCAAWAPRNRDALAVCTPDETPMNPAAL